MKQKLIRDIHRDFGLLLRRIDYFVCLFRILMNHREHWHPEKYTIETKTSKYNCQKESQITENLLKT